MDRSGGRRDVAHYGAGEQQAQMVFPAADSARSSARASLPLTSDHVLV